MSWGSKSGSQGGLRQQGREKIGEKIGGLLCSQSTKIDKNLMNIDEIWIKHNASNESNESQCHESNESNESNDSSESNASNASSPSNVSSA